MAQITANTSLPLDFLADHQPLSPVAAMAVRVAVTATKWRTRRNSRRALIQLDRHQLHDVGLTPEQARQECRRWFWQP